MITFDVPDMSCGHCVAAITKAVQSADPSAKVDIDLGAHRVRVEPASSDAQKLRVAIEDAGYTPALVDAA